MSTPAVTPDPYAAYGGAVASGGGADPYASYGGKVSASSAPSAPPSLRQQLLDNLQRNTQDLQPTGGFFHDNILAPAVHVANRMGQDVAGAAIDLVAPDNDLSPNAINARSKALVQNSDRPLTASDATEGAINAATNPGAPTGTPNPGLGTQLRGYAHTAKTDPGQAALDVVGDAGTAALLGGLTKTIPGPTPPVKGQNYTPDHAAAFEGAIAPAASMGKNFVPQNVTPEALTPIRATAARMAQGNPAEQGIVQAAMSSSTPPLQRIGAYQQIVKGALSDLEAQHAPELARVSNVPVDMAPIIQRLKAEIVPGMDANDASAIRNLAFRAQQVKTIGDLNSFRALLNTETAPDYRMSAVQQGRTGVSAQTTNDLSGWVRDAYYDNLQQATGTDFAPLKRQESNLFTTLESLQNQKAPLSKAEANFYAPTTLSEKAGNLANLIKDPKTTVTQTLLRESPATKVSTLLQKSLQDLPDAPPPTAPSPQPAGLLGRGAIPMRGSGTPNPTMQPPPFNYSTRAQRLGLLLPNKTGGPIELPYVPQMTPGERLAALQQLLRQSQPKALPAQATPIRLPPPQ